MNKLSKAFAILGLVLLVASISCVAGETPASREAPPAVVTRVTEAASPWNDLVAAAKKEGVVNIYGTAVEPTVGPLSEGFKRAYGIELQFVTGRPAEVQAKLMAERRAGLYLADIGHMGETTSSMDLEPAGVTVPLDNLLLLPEVTNPKNWMGGSLPYIDKNHHVLMFMAQAIYNGVANTDIIRENDIVSFVDLVKPEWKGKIVFTDPTISGTSPNEMAAMYKTFGKERALQLFAQLAANEPAITQDYRIMMEWVARGKYPLGIGQSMGMFAEFKRAGAPIRPLRLKEPRSVSGGPGVLTVFADRPHPKAAQLYINWLLTNEGSTIFSRSQGYVSTRLGVTREGLDPDTVPTAEDVFPDEDQLKLRVQMRSVGAEIFGQLKR